MTEASRELTIAEGIGFLSRIETRIKSECRGFVPMVTFRVGGQGELPSVYVRVGVPNNPTPFSYNFALTKFDVGESEQLHCRRAALEMNAYAQRLESGNG